MIKSINLVLMSLLTLSAEARGGGGYTRKS